MSFPAPRLVDVIRESTERGWGVDDEGTTYSEPLLPYLARLAVVVPMIICAVLSIFVAPIVLVLVWLGLIG